MLLVEFVDVECPFCSKFADTLEAFQRRHGATAEVRFAHYPLTQHRFALPGARMIECARSEGRADALLRELYRSQDKFGLEPWGSMAKRAGVKDTGAVAKCAMSPTTPSIIGEGNDVGRQIGITGTPGVVVNGWLLPYPPSGRVLDRLSASLTGGATMRAALDEAGLAPRSEP